jgi:hypothetical protein
LQQLGLADAPHFTSLIPASRNDPGRLVTYSTGSTWPQANGMVPDIYGKVMLGAIDGISVAVLNSSSVRSRKAYNVVPAGQRGVAPTSTVFVGLTSHGSHQTPRRSSASASSRTRSAVAPPSRPRQRPFT